METLPAFTPDQEARLREVLRDEVQLLLTAISPALARSYARERQMFTASRFRAGAGQTSDEFMAARRPEASPQAPRQTDE